MEIQIRIRTKLDTGETEYVRDTFTEHDLLEWAKARIDAHYSNREATEMYVEAIIPKGQ